MLLGHPESDEVDFRGISIQYSLTGCLHSSKNTVGAH